VQAADKTPIPRENPARSIDAEERRSTSDEHLDILTLVLPSGMCFDYHVDRLFVIIIFFRTSLTFKASLPSVLMLRLYREFFSMYVCITCFKFSNFEKFILKYFKIFACHPSDVQTKSEILLPLTLLGTPYESSNSGFSLFFF
jgi:hypothetical protein